MRRHRSVVSTATFAALVCSLVAFTPASAETRIAVSPAILDLAGPLGGAGTVEVAVNNGGDRPLALDTSVIELGTAEGLPSAVPWTEVRPSGQLVEPGERGTLTLELDIPADIEPGGHYAAVSIEASTTTEEAEQTSGVSGRIIVPVLIAVSGDEDRPMPLARPALDRSALFLYPDGVFRAKAEVSNAGGTHIALQGSVSIDALHADGGRERVAALDVPIGRVLPERVRSFPAADQATLAADASHVATYELWKPARGRTADARPELTQAVPFSTTPQLELDSLQACLAGSGELEASISLHNRGTIGIVPSVSFRTEDGDGEVTSVSRPIPEILAWPRTTTPARALMLAPFEGGESRLIAEVAIGADDILRAATVIRTGDGGTVPSCPATAGAD